MKRILLALLLLLSWVAPGYSQPISQYELVEIVELYADGQYGVVKAKLANRGFTVSQEEPDYTLHGVSHSGKFTFMYERESSAGAYRETGFKDVDRWFFETTSGPCFYKEDATLREISISFDLIGRGGADIYNQFCTSWHDAIDSTYTLCSPERKCRRFNRHWITKGVNPGSNMGEQKNENYTTLILESDQEPIKWYGHQPSPYGYLHGFFTQRAFYTKLPSPHPKVPLPKVNLVRKK
jgi:hypothetical protein